MIYHLLLALPALAAYIVYYSTALPRHFPHNIPVVPLWPSFYDVMVLGASRSDVYNKRVRPLVEKHGVVALWHEGWWTILITKPELLAKMFKNSNHCLKKKGLADRIPWNSGAKLFGINIIDSDDELYSYFRKLLMPAFMLPMQLDFLKTKANRLVGRLMDAQDSTDPGTGILVGPSVWRWALSVWGGYFMDAELGNLDFSQYNIQQILGVQNSKFMGRLKGLFPFLDRLPFKWPVTAHSEKLLAQVEKALTDLADERNKSPPPSGGESKLGFILHQAREQKQMSDFHYKSNLKQLFIAGHENVETVLNSAIEELAKDTDVQQRLYAEVTQQIPLDYSLKGLDQLPFLNSVIYEALRLYPPLGHMSNRLTTVPYQMSDDLVIAPGIMLGWHAYGVQTDPQEWGATAREFDPFRWGTDITTVKRNLRLRQAKGQFIPFGIYSRKCLGYNIALQFLQCTLCELVRSIEWNHPKGYKFAYGKVSTKTRN